MVTESKGTTVVAGLIHKGPTVSYRYTTLLDATPQFVYCVFSVMRVTRGLAYVGMELPPIPSTGGVSSEEDTAVKGWADQLAGDPLVGDLDYGSGDKIEWLGEVSNNVPQHFMELRRMKADRRVGAELYIPLTGHG